MNNETQRENELVMLYFKTSTTEERQAKFADLVASGADPDALARRIADKVAEERQKRRRLWRTRLLVAFAIGVVLWIFLFKQPMKEKTRSAVAAWLASPTPTVTVTGTPTPTMPPNGATPTPTATLTITPTPTPTIGAPELETWTFTGRITRYAANEVLADTRVSLQVRLSGGQEEDIPVTINDSGDFIGEFESTVAVEEAIVRISPPTASWQIRLTDDSAWKQDSADPNLFSTAISGTETPPLNLEAVVSRKFSGQVALSTSPEGTNAAGVPDIQLEIEESVDGQNWQAAHCGQTPDTQESFLLDEQGNFELTCDSGNEQAYYRLRPSLPAIYQASVLVEFVPEGWAVDENGWWTDQPLAVGEFTELSLLYQLQSVTLLVTDPYLTLEPNVESWEKGVYANADTEGGEYEAYVTTITNANANSLQAIWTLFLPSGDYYLEIWTPPGMTAPVKYEVELAEGSWGDADYLGDGYSYISRQERREGIWWNFDAPSQAGVSQPYLPIYSVGEEVKFLAFPFTALPDSYKYANTSMGVGPIRIIVGSIPTGPPVSTVTPIPTTAAATLESPTPEPSPTP